MKPLKQKWLVYSVAGLLLIGAGLSVSIDAAFLKAEMDGTYMWIYQGTLGLVLFNAGISLFGQAIIYRIKLMKQKNDL